MADIRSIKKYWSGINLFRLEESINMHKFCLISGEGGIGKTFFVKCLEEKLETKNIKHLCLYGKFCKDITTINFDEITEISKKETFVFIFDAINEIDESSQNTLFLKLKELMDLKGLRIVVTYRSYALRADTEIKYINLSKSQYTFPGVSFESVADWLSKQPVEDITEYYDVLNTNNPFLLSHIPLIIQNEKGSKQKNNISRFTHLYEGIIKLRKDKPIWDDTKTLTDFMYYHNTKTVSLEQVANIISNHESFISRMEERGFISSYEKNNTTYYSFTIESLADFLLARSLFNDIENSPRDTVVKKIKEKTDVFYSIIEAVIILLFDKYSPDYETIKEILKDTELDKLFSKSTLTKIHFNKEDIPKFHKVFKTRNTEDLFLYFAGYKNNPYNCTHYLNNYYLFDHTKQITELSKTLSDRFLPSSFKSRLKNIYYLTFKCDCDFDRLYENFYVALWACASGNDEIRTLSMKILNDILKNNTHFINELIKIYNSMSDYFIKDAIIQVLSCSTHCTSIDNFFKSLLNDYDFTLAKSIRRIENYRNNLYGWITLKKNNLLIKGENKISSAFESILYAIDMYDKNLLPFRFWGVKSTNLYDNFILADKHIVYDFNKKLNDDFGCVQNGVCNCRLTRNTLKKTQYQIPFDETSIEIENFLYSLEVVCRKVFKNYGLPFDDVKALRDSHNDFSTSVFKKCIMISIDILYGSLMCNYFTCHFSSFNNFQDSVGYDVYDPLENGEEIHINSPASFFHPKLEKINSFILRKINTSVEKTEVWWKDLEITQRNILELLTPFIFENEEWIILSVRISITDDISNNNWIDTYNIYCCTSYTEELKNDGNERYLTIELEDYTGNISEYEDNQYKSWLCKRIPSIKYDSNYFSNTALAFPPASIIKYLNLHLDERDMCWKNSVGDKIIICNNNKASYFNDPVTETIVIKKSVFDKLKQHFKIKHFAFAEKYLKDKGYCTESAYHFEIVDGKIIKKFPNYDRNIETDNEHNCTDCQKCKHKLYEIMTAPVEYDSKLSIFLKEYGV